MADTNDEGTVAWERANKHHDKAQTILEGLPTNRWEAGLIHTLLALDHRLAAMAHDFAAGQSRGSQSG